MTYQIDRPWLLLPIEVKTRELDSKVLLACEAVARGYGVVVGPNGFNQDLGYPRGIYFDKCISPHKVGFLRYQVEELGNKLVSQDEEGLLYISESGYIATRTSRQTVELSSLICSWGQKQHLLLSQNYRMANKLVSTGSPRVDLWQKVGQIYKSDITAIKQRYKRYVLVSSNFASCRDESSIERFISDKRKLKLSMADEADQLRERLRYFISVKETFLDLVRILSREVTHEANLNILIRPHPSDDMTIWEDLRRERLENVYICNSGDISPYIAAAEVVVHNNCTTAIEAALNGVPTIAYRKYTDSRFEYGLPNHLGLATTEASEVCKILKMPDIKKSIEIPPEGQKLLEEYILLNRDSTACKRIVDALDTLTVSNEKFSWNPYSLPNILASMRQCIAKIKSWISEDAYHRRYKNQKNPGIKLVELNRIVSQHNISTGAHIQVKKLKKDVFSIY